jgi:quercetin dioxygenase-like cupin family protein
MRSLLMATACLAAAPIFAVEGGSAGVRLLLDDGRVRVFRASTAAALSGHPAAVVVRLEDGATRKAGDAYWCGDAAARPGERDPGPFIIVEPRESVPLATPAPGAAGGGTPSPGAATFTGMSFKPLFENERVRVIRGRMEVGAREGLHTHASDIVVIYLSDGAIEDTADGRTKVNRWKRGDVELEPRGSSHSARNLGPAVDAVLVTLKP